MSDFDKVLKHWGPVEADYDGIGNLILTRLFIQYPETQKKFPRFANIPQGELASNDQVSAHGAILLRKVAEVLRAKGNHGEILKTVTDSHANKHKVQFENFKWMNKILIEVMREKAGFDADAQAALQRVMDALIGDIGAIYQKMGFKA